MTFRGLTELQEQSRNAAHMSAITHRVETNGWSQRDRGRKWIATGYGWMDDRRWMTGGG